MCDIIIHSDYKKERILVDIKKKEMKELKSSKIEEMRERERKREEGS